MQVRLIWITPDAEKIIGYCARVSNPANQDNPDVEKLLAYCVKNRHWSVFETAGMNVEIETSRAISAQILRHRSFSFQEFSLRYAEAIDFQMYPARRQDGKNRQNSIDDLDDDVKDWFIAAQNEVQNLATVKYKQALAKGIAKEQARFLLPMSTTTKLYMNGTIRSWIHYLDLRSGNGTQKEHMDIALGIREIFNKELPTIAKALQWI